MSEPTFAPYWIFMQDDFRGKGISNGVHRVEVKVKGKWVWIKFPQRVQAKKIRLWQWEKIPSTPDTGQDFAAAVAALRKEQTDESPGRTCSIEGIASGRPNRRRRLVRRGRVG